MNGDYCSSSLVSTLVVSTHLKVADLHVQREGVEHHGADEGDARRHGVHDLEFAVGRVRWLVSDFVAQFPTLDFVDSAKEIHGQSIKLAC